MEAICGVRSPAATCHVIVAESTSRSLVRSSEDEEDMLDQGFDITRTSRLGCQIKMAPNLTACEYDCRHGDNAARLCYRDPLAVRHQRASIHLHDIEGELQRSLFRGFAGERLSTELIEFVVDAFAVNRACFQACLAVCASQTIAPFIEAFGSVGFRLL